MNWGGRGSPRELEVIFVLFLPIPDASTLIDNITKDELLMIQARDALFKIFTANPTIPP